MSFVHRLVVPPSLALLVLGALLTGDGCEAGSAGSDACDGSCPGTTMCSTVCLCDASDCPSFACVEISEGGEYQFGDGAIVPSCSTP